MSFSPQFEADYIRQFSKIVRRGTTSLVYAEWFQRIRDASSEIADPKTKKEALNQLARISNCDSAIETPEENRTYISEELEKLADFVSRMKNEHAFGWIIIFAGAILIVVGAYDFFIQMSSSNEPTTISIADLEEPHLGIATA